MLYMITAPAIHKYKTQGTTALVQQSSMRRNFRTEKEKRRDQ